MHRGVMVQIRVGGIFQSEIKVVFLSSTCVCKQDMYTCRVHLESVFQ